MQENGLKRKLTVFKSRECGRIKLKEGEKMLPAERLRLIKQLLTKKEELTTNEVALKLAVSKDTVRRDFDHLAQTGQALRIHGGLMTLGDSGVPNFKERTKILSPLKHEMAKLAAKFVSHDGLYYFDTSTTLVQLAKLIDFKGTTIVTNSLDNALALTNSRLMRVELLGGTLNKHNRFTSSMTSLGELANYQFDVAFIGTSRLSPAGIFVVDQDDSYLPRQAIKQARKVVVVAEQYKFHTDRSSFKVCDLNELDVLITDEQLTKTQRKWFRSDTQILYAK